jgi:hypothetical protein
VVHIQGLAERRNQALHTVSERNSEEVAVPIVVHTEVEVVHMVVVVVHTEVVGAVPVVHMVVEVARTEAAGAVPAAHMVVEVAVPNLAVAVGLDHKTWINPSRRIFIISHCAIQGNVQYHSTGVKANRQVSINVCQERELIEQVAE